MQTWVVPYSYQLSGYMAHKTLDWGRKSGQLITWLQSSKCMQIYFVQKPPKWRKHFKIRSGPKSRLFTRIAHCRSATVWICKQEIQQFESDIGLYLCLIISASITSSTSAYFFSLLLLLHWLALASVDPPLIQCIISMVTCQLFPF